MTKRTIHLVCNAHIDPVWQWEWEEGVAATLGTFRAAADFCEEFEGFIFNHNEALLYRWVEDYEPALFARIQRLVKEGKWHIMGGWHLQPDCNMPSGESFVRQILLGRRYFWEKFGAAPTVALNFDPFGHTRGLVQILARSGYDSYIHCRPDQNDCPLEKDEYIWEGYDGSRVLATRPFGWYGSPLGKAREKVEKCLAEKTDSRAVLLLWGVGDHGGGPSRQDLRALADLIASTTGDEVVHSTAEAYFTDLRKDIDHLPVHCKDLNPWGVGCYTSQVRIKQKHRLLENELFSAEKMISAAWAQGLIPYPTAELEAAMYDLATAEFHDILPGSSIQPVEEMALRLMDHGLEGLSRVKTRAFFALAGGQPAARENEIPILVYNPHPFPVETTVECEYMLADANWGETYTTAVVYQGDRPLPTQIEKEQSNLALDWRKRAVFRTTLAPSQMNRFDCRLEVLPAHPILDLPAQAGEFSVKTDRLDAAVSADTGLLSRYRVDGVDLLADGAGRLLVIEDNSDPWGMLVRSYRKVIGAFELLSPEEAATFAGVLAPTLTPVRVVEDGAVRTVVEALFKWGESKACLRYKLPKQGTETELEVRVHWNEKDRMLKLSLPLAAIEPGSAPAASPAPTSVPAASPDPTSVLAGGGQFEFRGQVAYGWDVLPMNGDEAVAQKWLAVVAPARSAALTVINDGLYGSDFAEGELRLSLLRSPAYTAHPISDRPLLPQDRYSPRIDQGERLFRFWLNAGPLDECMAAVDREALVRNEKPAALSFFPSGAGELPRTFLTLSDEAVQVTAAKKAEGGEDLVLRLFEPTGRERATTVALPFAGLSKGVTLRPYEVRTYLVDLKSGTWTETDLLEKPV